MNNDKIRNAVRVIEDTLSESDKFCERVPGSVPADLFRSI